MRVIKFRSWDGITMELINDLYWFEENQVHEIDNDDIGGFKIMQFTGLKDKNGVDIYEGDVLMSSDPLPFDNAPKIRRMPSDTPHTVYFHEGAFKFKHNKRSVHHFLNGLVIRVHGLEVVGNIYQNKELLK